MLNRTIPDDSKLPTNGGPIHLSSTKSALESFYKSEEKCALWIFPYHCIQFKNVLKAPGLSSDVDYNPRKGFRTDCLLQSS